MAYIVWDLKPGYGTKDRQPYWSATAYVPDIISAKRWTTGHTQSMITEHDDEDAFRIYRSKQLPQTYKVIS